MPERVSYRDVTVVGRPLPLLSEDRTREVGFGQFGHHSLDLSLNVLLILSQDVDRGRTGRVIFLRRERESRAVLHPEVKGALRMREDVEQGRERRAPVAS